MSSPQALARFAGLLYLALAVLGGWAHLGARASIYVPGDAASTTANIVANEQLFRLALVADLVMATVFVLLGMTLHRLLADTSARLATTLLVFVSVGAGSIALNLVFHVGALIVATDPSYADVAARESLTLLLLDLHANGYVLGGIFFGLWLLPMGLIAYRSPYFGRVAGVILVVGSVAWLLDPVIAFGLPDAPAALRAIVEVPTSVAEFGLILFLLIVGVRRPKKEVVARSELVGA